MAASTRRRILFLILFAFPIADARSAASANIPVLTVCEALSDADKYEGKSVIIVGRTASTDEGVWLTEDCGLKVVRGDREFGAQISTVYSESDFAPPPRLPDGFKWDKRLLHQKLTQIKQTTELHTYKDRKYNEHWYAMFGRLETRLPRRLSRGNNIKAYTNGFGHLSESPAQLVSPGNGSLRLK